MFFLKLFFKSSLLRNTVASAAFKYFKYVPKNSSDDRCLLFCIYSSSMAVSLYSQNWFAMISCFASARRVGNTEELLPNSQLCCDTLAITD